MTKNGKDIFTKHIISLKVQKPTSHQKVDISDDFFPTGSWAGGCSLSLFFAG